MKHDLLVGDALVEKLKILCRHTDEIIYELRCDEDERAKHPVNWADVKAMSAYIGCDNDGWLHHLVIVEEADPQAYDFQEYIEERLRERGWETVIVITQW